MTHQPASRPETILTPRILIALFFLSSLSFSMWSESERNFRKAALITELASFPIFERKPKYSAFPEISAAAYSVTITRETEILAAKEEQKPYPPASLTKILTALVSLELLNAEDIVIITKEVKAGGEKISVLPVGSKITRNEAIRLLLIDSANDIALALADAAGKRANIGSFSERIEYFGWQMNKRALEIGLRNSKFINPTGLDSKLSSDCAGEKSFKMSDECGPGNLVTAADLSILSRYILEERPWLWEITKEAEATIYTIGSYSYKIKNTNLLLSEFPGIIGGKTGTTDLAGETLIILYPIKPDKSAIIIILKSKDRFSDGRKIISWLEENFP